MYGITSQTLEGVNFYAGPYPVARGVFDTEEDIEKGTPVVKEGDAVKAATSATLPSIIGIASSDSDSGSVAVDFTGEILASCVKVPEGVDKDTLIDECRKHCIFLR